MKKNIIADKSYGFAVSIVNLSRELVKKKEYVISRQIIKSGTSIGANVEEAIGGISKRDFRAKMSISYKEARETHYWLRILKDTNYINIFQFNSLEVELTSILKILYRIIESSKE
ncbi:MAG: four helix bundle protein [Flavobacteriaceae bacterium]